jgi:squalene-associated FAD-dependent desaturase
MKGLGAGDKLRTLYVARALRASGNGGASPTVSEWLDGLRQSERIKKRFWYPMAIATLNEDPEIASSKMLRKVLELAFDGKRRDASIGIARVGLSDLYTTGAARFVESHGGSIRTGAKVRSLVVEQGRAIACDLAGNERVEGDWFISAVPPQAFLRMLPGTLQKDEFAPLERLGSSPIVSINLWFDRPVTDREFVGLLGTNIQWLFNKDLIVSPGRESNHLALVISAARRFVGLTKTALTEMALAELRELLPSARPATVTHSRVVKEPDATLSHTVESDLIRPGARTSIPNLLLAGDWTDTGLPATIESAVLSGKKAAELVWA